MDDQNFWKSEDCNVFDHLVDGLAFFVLALVATLFHFLRLNEFVKAVAHVHVAKAHRLRGDLN